MSSCRISSTCSTCYVSWIQKYILVLNIQQYILIQDIQDDMLLGFIIAINEILVLIQGSYRFEIMKFQTISRLF